MSFSLNPSLPFVGGIDTITQATLNYWRACISQAVDGAGGGEYTPTAPIEITGSGMRVGILTLVDSLNYEIKLATGVSETRVVPGFATPSVGVGAAGAWQLESEGGWLDTSSSAVGPMLDHGLRVPNGATLNGVTVHILGGGGHGSLPASMPTIDVRKRPIAGTASSSLGSATDTSATVILYEGYHTISVSGLSEVVDNTSYVYFIVYRAEHGANAQIGSRYYGATNTWTRVAMGRD